VKAELQQLLGEGVDIDHVGSTAIPDICGKNIIDVLVGADDLEDFQQKLDLISGQGYFASQNSKNEIYQFFASKQGETGDGDVHIHLVVKGTDRYEDFLKLRDYLLAFPKEAEAYSNHKKELVGLGVVDRKEYRRVKSEYVSAMIDRARMFAEEREMK
jgi:GrpB-like predicted nucleotidyltransferase (UPF0157 family)